MSNFDVNLSRQPSIGYIRFACRRARIMWKASFTVLTNLCASACEKPRNTHMVLFLSFPRTNKEIVPRICACNLFSYLKVPSLFECCKHHVGAVSRAKRRIISQRKGRINIYGIRGSRANLNNSQSLLWSSPFLFLPLVTHDLTNFCKFFDELRIGSMRMCACLCTYYVH